MTTHLVVLNACDAIPWYRSPFLVRAYPQFRVDLILGYDFARQNVSHEQVVVHRLRNNFCDRRRLEFDESVVL